METTYEALLSAALHLSQNGKQWHHHYLPPQCHFNQSIEHSIILESTEATWECNFDHKPMQELERLENLFFNRP